MGTSASTHRGRRRAWLTSSIGRPFSHPHSGHGEDFGPGAGCRVALLAILLRSGPGIVHHDCRAMQAAHRAQALSEASEGTKQTSDSVTASLLCNSCAPPPPPPSPSVFWWASKGGGFGEVCVSQRLDWWKLKLPTVTSSPLQQPPKQPHEPPSSSARARTEPPDRLLPAQDCARRFPSTSRADGRRKHFPTSPWKKHVIPFFSSQIFKSCLRGVVQHMEMC